MWWRRNNPALLVGMSAMFVTTDAAIGSNNVQLNIQSQKLQNLLTPEPSTDRTNTESASQKKRDFVSLDLSGRLAILLRSPPYQTTDTSTAKPIFPSKSNPTVALTAGYDFRKRWYGLQSVRSIFSWNRGHQSNDNDEDALLPHRIALSIENNLDHKNLLDSAELSAIWDKAVYSPNYSIPDSVIQKKPSISVGFQRRPLPTGHLETTWPIRNNPRLIIRTKSIIKLIRSGSRSQVFEQSIPESNRYDDDEEWYIPRVEMDTRGMATSNNQFRTQALNQDVHLQLKFRKQLSSFLSFGTILDDESSLPEDQQTWVQFQVSTQNKQQPTSRVIARVEGAIESFSSTSRLALEHEHFIPFGFK